MGKTNHALLAFNRGIISKLGLARIDVQRVQLSAEVQTNWLPRILGSMMLRCGTAHLGSTLNDNKAIFIPFIFSKTQTALVEFTEDNIRFWVNDELLTRESVTTAITNGDFSSGTTGWTDNDESGATSDVILGAMNFTGNGLNYARRTQLVSAFGNTGIQHGIRITISNGPIIFKIGTVSGDDDIFAETTLGTGTHSLTFTPETDFYIDFSSSLQRTVILDSVEIEAAGTLVLPSPYAEADLLKIRWDQSLDVFFLAGASKQQRELQRRGDGSSWSIILYEPEDGPVRVENTTEIALTASGLNGNITLTSNAPLFKSEQIGGVWKIISNGQNVEGSFSSANVFTDTIEVTGSGTARNFTVTISGTFSATLTLQRSFDEGLSWFDVQNFTSTTTGTIISDGLTGQITLYRIGIKTGNYTSGTANATLSFSAGSITGYARLTAFNSTTSVDAEVLKSLGSTNETTKWSEAEWSKYRGFPAISFVFLKVSPLTFISCISSIFWVSYL